MSETCAEQGGRPRLLLVEDDPAVRRSLQLLMQSRGYDVRAYRTGAGLAEDREALRAVCLVADFLLPDGDALGLLDALRAVGWDGAAILITGHADAPMREAARSLGYEAVLAKPVADGELIGWIARLVSNARPPRPKLPAGRMD